MLDYASNTRFLQGQRGSNLSSLEKDQQPGKNTFLLTLSEIMIAPQKVKDNCSEEPRVTSLRLYKRLTVIMNPKQVHGIKQTFQVLKGEFEAGKIRVL